MNDFEQGVGNVIAADFRHGKNLKMGNYCVIQEGVEVGDDVEICDYVLLKRGTRIGSRVYVDSYVKSSGGNWIGDDVTLRFNCTIAREVTVEDGAFISPNVMTIYSTSDREKRPGTVIGAGAHIGTAAVIGPGLKIAPGAHVGAMAMVTRDLPDRAVYVGIPAVKVRDLPEPEAPGVAGGE